MTKTAAMAADMPRKKKRGWKKFIWPFIGIIAIVTSFWLLTKELHNLSWDALWERIDEIGGLHWWLIGFCTICSYAALAFYDHVALDHIGRRLRFHFVALTSLTTYAIGHNIGASVFTGAVVRYRAYTSKGLSGPEVGVIVSFCTFTYILGVMVLLGLVFLIVPDLEVRLGDFISPAVLQWGGGVLLALVALYMVGSALGLPPLRIRRFAIAYPRLPIAFQQLILGPVEQLFAVGIFYFALPDAGNPGYLVVMAVFVISFSLALISHAPGGLGVFELAMLTGLPEFSPETVLAALIIFRLFYFIVPFFIGLVVIVCFERVQLRES